MTLLPSREIVKRSVASLAQYWPDELFGEQAA
jgi:hypothetical protein